jgi:hypothetical protein
MPGGRKPKIDGAFQDVTLKPIPGSDKFGGYTQQENQIDAVGKPPADMFLPEDAAAMQYKPEDIFAKPTERKDESGLADTQAQEVVNLPIDTNLDVIKEIIQNNYGYKIRRRFR